jgi:hypothetical protein
VCRSLYMIVSILLNEHDSGGNQERMHDDEL